MKILCSVLKRNFYVFYISTLFLLQVFLLFVQLTDLGSKKPLQLAHFGYEDAKILGTKVWGGSLDFNLHCFSAVFGQHKASVFCCHIVLPSVSQTDYSL